MIFLYVIFCMSVKALYHAYSYIQCINDKLTCAPYDATDDLNNWFIVELGVVIAITWHTYVFLLFSFNKTKKTHQSISILLLAVIPAITAILLTYYERFNSDEPKDVVSARIDLAGWCNSMLVAISAFALELRYPTSSESLKKNTVRCLICTICAIYAYFNLIGAWYVFQEHTDETYTTFTHYEAQVLIVVTFLMVCLEDGVSDRIVSISWVASLIMCSAGVGAGSAVLQVNKTYELFIYHFVMYSTLAVGLFFYDPFFEEKPILGDKNINNDEIKAGLLNNN